MAGIGLGYLLSRSLAAQFATVIALPTSPDLRVFFITAGASLATSVAFGLFPALHATRADVRRVLGDAGGGTIAGRGNRWPTQLMVVSQIALGIVLVMAAGLLIRTFSHLTRQPSNIDHQTSSPQPCRCRMPAIERRTPSTRCSTAVSIASGNCQASRTQRLRCRCPTSGR